MFQHHCDNKTGFYCSTSIKALNQDRWWYSSRLQIWNYSMHLVSHLPQHRPISNSRNSPPLSLCPCFCSICTVYLIFFVCILIPMQRFYSSRRGMNGLCSLCFCFLFLSISPSFIALPLSFSWTAKLLFCGWEPASIIYAKFSDKELFLGLFKHLKPL